MKRLLIVVIFATAAGQLTHAAGDHNTIASTTSATEPAVQVHVRHRSAVSEGLTLLVKIEPHPDNRTLRVVLDSSAFYRASYIQIDGASARRHHWVTWKTLPPGDYCIDATLTRVSGTVRTDHVRHSAPGFNVSSADGRPQGSCFTRFDIADSMQLASTRGGPPRPFWEIP